MKSFYKKLIRPDQFDKIGLAHSIMQTTTLCLIFMILISLENVKKYSHVVARLPQRLKSTLFEIFSNVGYPSGTLHSKKFQTMLILAFGANSAFVQQK